MVNADFLLNISIFVNTDIFFSPSFFLSPKILIAFLFPDKYHLYLTVHPFTFIYFLFLVFYGSNDDLFSQPLYNTPYTHIPHRKKKLEKTLRIDLARYYYVLISYASERGCSKDKRETCLETQSRYNRKGIVRFKIPKTCSLAQLSDLFDKMDGNAPCWIVIAFCSTRL